MLNSLDPFTSSYFKLFNKIPGFKLSIEAFIDSIILCLYAGKNCFVWFGPKPMILIMESEQIREIFAKNYVYQKPHHSNPVANLLARGIANYEEDKWAKHRKILKPAFHMEKLKVLLYLIICLHTHFFFCNN